MLFTDLSSERVVNAETYSLEAFEEILNCGVGGQRIAVNWTGNIKLCPIQDVTWLNLGSINNIENNNVQKNYYLFTLWNLLI